jgi:hypothetical protein
MKKNIMLIPSVTKKPMSHNTTTVTTFNFLHDSSYAVERLSLVFSELNVMGTDICFFQEVNTDLGLHVQRFAEYYGWYVSFGESTFGKHGEYSNVTFTKEPVTMFENIQPSYTVQKKLPPPLLWVETENNVTFNGHLVWGMRGEPDRLLAATILDNIAHQYEKKGDNRTVFLGGDFNAGLNSTVLRYLQGLHIHEDQSTRWTNVWDVHAPWSTARKDGGWAEQTAHGVNIVDPSLMPDRTIDHLLTYGWNYGKKGHPLNVHRFGSGEISNGYGISDHYGVTAQFIS